MAKTFGKRIIELAGVVESIQPCTSSQITPLMTIKKRGPVAGACWMGVHCGLLVVVERSKPKQFRVAHDWREKVAARLVPTPQRQTTPKPPIEERPAQTVATALANRHPLEQVWPGIARPSAF